ncbi:MAG TPA: hypothetical protein PKV66_02995, partial [Candidatus Pelethenecus sp.]|nr:hypothetical protein [Candidatus Pelethenecus sp.]
MVQTNKNKNILRTDVGGGYSPITKTYQDIANIMGNTSNSIQKDSSGDKTLQIYKDIASQMPSPNGNTVPTSTPTPATSTNENSDIVKAYQESANRLLSEKEALDPNDKNYRIEADTYNSKIESTNELIKSYMQNSKNSISAKANAELAQQNAVNGTAAYLKALGLSGQGIAESTMADVNKNYANAMAGIEAQENENNSNAQNSYLEALKQAESERQSRLDQKDLIEDQRAYEEKREAQQAYLNILRENGMMNIEDSETGAIDIDVVNTYKEELEKALADGKINQSGYDEMLNLYRNYANQYEKILTNVGFSRTSEDPKGSTLREKDSKVLNELLNAKGLKVQEGIKYNYKGKEVVYKNGEWKYL